jgi:hypothetical protein
MLRPQGYVTLAAPDAPLVERDTITCGHCQRIIFTKPGSVATTYLLPGRLPSDPWREEPGAGCRVCMRAICLHCHDQGRCTPFERRIEAMEGNRRAIEALLRV